MARVNSRRPAAARQNEGERRDAAARRPAAATLDRQLGKRRVAAHQRSRQLFRRLQIAQLHDASPKHQEDETVARIEEHRHERVSGVGRALVGKLPIFSYIDRKQELQSGGRRNTIRSWKSEKCSQMFAARRSLF